MSASTETRKIAPNPDSEETARQAFDPPSPAELREVRGARGRIADLDVRLLEWLRRRRAPGFTRSMLALTELGSVNALFTVAAGATLAFLRRREPRAALFVVCASAGAGIVTQAMKQVFARNRPERSLRLTKVVGFAFPSGHSSGSAATYGALALLLAGRGLPWPARAFGVLVPAVVGASRVYLYVHFPSDVVAGWLVGATWLGLVRLVVGSPLRG